jgi:penicillin amidase
MTRWSRPAYRTLFSRLSLVLVILVLAAAAYALYSFRRPLPQTDGAILLAGLREEVVIYRDSWGVPHIYATNSADLFFAQGYVEAQDHWWALESQRHLGRGQLNRIYGNQPDVLATDRFITALGWADQAEADWESTSGETHSALRAYSAGVNAYINERDQGDLALQYTLLGLTGRGFEVLPWQPSDSLAWAIAYHWQLSSDFPEALARLTLSSRFDPALLPSSYQAPFPVPAQTEWTFIGGDARALTLMPRPVPPQTQAWVWHGSQTDSGLPMLANSLYYPLTLPNPWYEVGLHCLEVSDSCPYDVVGMSLVGIPGVVVGHNGAIAWGISLDPTPTQRLSVVQVNPRWPTLYRQAEGWQRMTVGRFEPADPDQDSPALPVYRSTQGVIITDLREGLSSALALDWPIPHGGQFVQSLLQVSRAQTWGDFRQALAEWQGAPQFFLYADEKGSIGMVGVGATPQERYYPPPATPDTPLIAPASYPGDPTASRLLAMLGEGKVTLESQSLAQSDTYQSFPSVLIAYLLALDPAQVFDDPDQQSRLSDFRAWLFTWDGHSELESPHAALFNLWWALLTEALFDDDLGYPTGGLLPERQAILELLANPAHPWWDDLRTEETRENRDQSLALTFMQAVETAESQFQGNRDLWRWGDLLQAEFRTAPIEPLDLSEALNRRVTLLDGDFFSLKASPWIRTSDGTFEVVSAPAWRVLLDLSDSNRSRSILATGQSGHPASPHYADMTDLWRGVAYKDMGWDYEIIRAEHESALILRPAPFDSLESQNP